MEQVPNLATILKSLRDIYDIINYYKSHASEVCFLAALEAALFFPPGFSALFLAEAFAPLLAVDLAALFLRASFEAETTGVTGLSTGFGDAIVFFIALVASEV